MATPATRHVTPAEGGTWAVKLDEEASASSVHRTRAEAVADALEALQYRAEAEVFIHGPDGEVGSILTIRDPAPPSPDPDELDDPAARAEALRLTPGYARLRAGVGKRPPPPGDFDREEMAC